MHPHQQYSQTGGGTGAPYPPQQSPYGNFGAYPQQQQQQQPYSNPSPYGSGYGVGSGYQQNMASQQGAGRGVFGGVGNPFGQGSNQPGGNPYGPSGGSTGPGGYPSSGQQPFGGNPYGQPNVGSGSGYPPSQGGYPPSSGGYPGQQPGGGYPPQGGYPSGGGYPPSQGAGGYPSQGGGYPPSQGSGGYPPSSGGYPPSQAPGGYPPSSGGYPPSQGPGGYPSRGGGDGYPSQQPGGFGGPPTGAGGFGSDQRSQRLTQIIQQYEINQQFAARLRALEGCEIVLLCDDSGSMNTPLQSSNQTRWEEMKSLVNIIVDICAVMDSNGIDVYFLNRRPLLNVTDTRSVHQEFNTPPQGMTPLTSALRHILSTKRSQTFEKKLLILVATDGAPTNDQGQTDVGSLEAVLRNERTPQTYVTFLACTDDLDAVGYLSNWDKSMANLDVIDDYRSEKVEIQRVRGPNFPFSFGDYIVKALLGSIDPWFDSLDERA